ncbi:hypothetical protein, partial [Georgenia thermotolerans]
PSRAARRAAEQAARRPTGPVGTLLTAAASGRRPAPRVRGWRLPRWAELTADRVWVGTMTVVLVVLVILVGVALGSLGAADSSSAGRVPADSYSSTTVKDD